MATATSLLVFLHGVNRTWGIANEHHADGPPVIDGIRIHIDVHEQGIGLPPQQQTPFSVGVTQPQCRLPSALTYAKQIDFQLEVER